MSLTAAPHATGHIQTDDERRNDAEAVARINRAMLDINFVDAALDVLEYCAFPDYTCPAKRSEGTGYCAQHLPQMRTRRSRQHDADEAEKDRQFRRKIARRASPAEFTMATDGEDA